MKRPAKSAWPDFSQEPLFTALEAVRAELEQRSWRATVLISRFACAPQFDRLFEIYPLAIGGAARANAYSQWAREMAGLLSSRAGMDLAESGDGQLELLLSGPTRAAWVLAGWAVLRGGEAPVEAGAWVVGVSGLEELLDGADDPDAYPLLCQLAPSWDGSAGALAQAVRLGIGRSAWVGQGDRE